MKVWVASTVCCNDDGEIYDDIVFNGVYDDIVFNGAYDDIVFNGVYDDIVFNGVYDDIVDADDAYVGNLYTFLYPWQLA